MGEGTKGNLPCPCGSGKKYKECCFLKSSRPPITKPPEVPEEVINHFRKQIAKKKALEDMGIYINFVKPVIFKGRKVWAIGSRVYYNRPPHETFHQFIIDILRLTLGKEWWNNELRLPEEQRHFIVKCFLKFYEWQKKKSVKQKKVTEKIWAAKPDGWTKSLLALAFDVCSLVHTHHLPEQLSKRLKNRNEYQGARYEIAIAAILARLGCNIRFLDEKEKLTIKHCEFVAMDQKTGASVAVEAKSRHRPGILHTPGIRKEEKLLKGDVQRLLKEALEQNPGDKSFMIFIDINSPPTPGVKMEEKQWFKDIVKMMQSYGGPTRENPAPYNGIFLTNYSYHYQTEKEAEPGEHLSIIPFHSKFPLPGPDFLKMLSSALANYGNVPNLDLEYSE